jgi:hypothetical protein
VKEALQRETMAYDNERLATNLVCHDLGVPLMRTSTPSIHPRHVVLSLVPMHANSIIK